MNYLHRYARHLLTKMIGRSETEDVHENDRSAGSKSIPKMFTTNDWNEENKVFDKISTGHRSSSRIVLANCIVDNIQVSDNACTLILRNCTIGILQVGCVEFDELIIENCVINEFLGWHARFNGPCSICNSVFKGEFTLYASGYNKQEIQIENNVFCSFAEFYDSVYEAPFIMINNIFVEASDILGCKGTSVEVIFKGGSQIENNIGNIYYDSVTVE